MHIRKIPFWASATSLVLSSFSFAQGPLVSVPEAPSNSVELTAPAVAPQPTYESHKFLDRKNRILFAMVAASSAADFAVTRSNLQNGGQELNPLVRPFGKSSAGLAVNFAGETAGVICMSYLLHKTGHHKLEHAISYVNISASTGAVAYGLTHR
ncbi:MAG TPA: hypothetical protein VGS27_07540 [Candidatus Sulfotelmatobacter sp.]|nr:hypothetical protein [Candidatus Sulfotelmatobacter sp.]